MRPTNRSHDPDLGLEIAVKVASTSMHPGECMSCTDIAHFAGMSRQGVKDIEAGALKKLRLYMDPKLKAELFDMLNDGGRNRQVGTTWEPKRMTTGDLWRDR